MSKWKCGICGSKFDNFQAQGFEGTIYCPLCYFKKLYKDTELEREKLQKQLQQKENIIKEVREYIELWHYRNDFRVTSFTTGVKKELLEIIDKINSMEDK